MLTINRCLELLHDRGDSEYGGEPVTQLEHALQCAMLAEGEHASPTLIAAALLHDVGHLLHGLPDDAPDQGIDDAHEELGCRFLRQLFGDAVVEPVRLHVPAKRYLSAKYPEYRAQLSGPSVVSLELQGGVMSNEEMDAFERLPHFEDAVRLRHWDDAAKIPELPTPPLEHYAQHLIQAASLAPPHHV